MKKKLFVFIFLFLMLKLSAQIEKDLWSRVYGSEIVSGEKKIFKYQPSNSIYYHLDINKFRENISSLKNTEEHSKFTNQFIQFPNIDGKFNQYEIKESSTLEPAYQAKHPEIRTYIGKNTKDPSSIISFSITPQGLHVMIFDSKTGTQFIDPYDLNGMYIVYNTKDFRDIEDDFQCFVPDDIDAIEETNKKTYSKEIISHGVLRTYRLALASTVEYSEFHWSRAGLTDTDSEEDKKAAVLAAMVIGINRVNLLFQRDLAIKLIIIEDNEKVIFITEDEYDITDINQMYYINRSIMSRNFDFDDYDIGHVLYTRGGGVANLGSVCSGSKAMGVSGKRDPIGDGFFIRFVAHEMAHQFGARHTFNGNTGPCLDHRSKNTAYEPGSGSSIMSYNGICPPQNVPGPKGTYFHQASINEIWTNITSGRFICGTEEEISNSKPVANAGQDYFIPISTAYKLTGSSSDPDGITTHTYTWEQYDLGPAGMPAETDINGPLVRSFEGTSNPVRHIPKYEDYLANNGSSIWEVLPSVNRSITYALTVRDNDVTEPDVTGQTDVDFMNIFVSGSEPFTVINPISWLQGTTVNIQWVVGQSADVATINCQSVNIKLSTDGGVTFPIDIATNTPNDGSFYYTVPEMPNNNDMRLLIEAADNIFYDISDFNFSVSDEPDFFIANEVLTPMDCISGTTEAVYNFDYVAVNGFSDRTTFTALGIPGGATVAFFPDSRTTSGNVTMTISNLDDVIQNNYNITIRGLATSKTKNKEVIFHFFNSFCSSSGNMDSNASITKVQFNTINEVSGKSAGYTNHTVSTDISIGESYDLNVNVNTDGYYRLLTKAWIDWNQNCRFETGEEYDLGYAFNLINGETSISPLVITVPITATLGSTIMRISTRRGSIPPNACDNNFNGEVEDYTLNITEQMLSMQELEFENFLVFPNPNTGEFTIKFDTGTSKKINIEIKDIRGRVVYRTIYSKGGDFEKVLDLKNVHAGIYILNITDGLKKSIKKIIVE